MIPHRMKVLVIIIRCLKICCSSNAGYKILQFLNVTSSIATKGINEISIFGNKKLLAKCMVNLHMKHEPNNSP